jgi:hypothetical protein
MLDLTYLSFESTVVFPNLTFLNQVPFHLHERYGIIQSFLTINLTWLGGTSWQIYR